ncbi:DUF6239 family natural product biosynthesis protein [Actinophytocola sp. KF-1]
MLAELTPAVLLAQGGGHGHVLTVGVSIGPTVLRMALLAAIPVVAGFALLRGFLAEPDQRTRTAVIAAACGAVVLELLLSGGLDLSERLVPLVLALLVLPLYLVRSRDPRFTPAVDLARRFAPWIFWPAAVAAVGLFARAWLVRAEPARTETALHTGVVVALVALAWFTVARSGWRERLGGCALAMVLMAGAAQAMVMSA